MQLPLHDYWSLLARYLRVHRGNVFVLALLLLGSIGLQLINPQLVRRFIDAAQAGRPMQTLLGVALLFLGAALLNYLLTLGMTYLSEDIGWRTTNALRADLATHCLRLDLRFHHHYTPGALIERIDGDVGQLAHFFSQLVLQIAGNALLLLGILSVLFGEDWRLGLGFLAFISGALLILLRLRNFATPYLQAERAASADLFGFLEERLSGVDDIRANGAVAYTLQQLFLAMRAFWRAGLAARTRAALFGSIIVVWYELGTALALALGALLFLRDALSIGTIYLLYAYVRMLTGPLMEMTSELQRLQEASAAILRINELLAEQSQISDGPGTSLPDGPLAVTFDQISFDYPTSTPSTTEIPLPLLHDFTLRLPPGRTLGLLGRTGSGKTTLTRLLLRLHDPQAGAIRLGETDLRQITQATVRRHVGIVTQDVQLFHASVRDNLIFFDARIGDAAVAQALAAVGLQEWLNALPSGLDTLLTAGGSTLSAGEAQLLAFARVLLRDPGVVILDEASSRLDPMSEQRLDHAISRLIQNRTAIIIAHRLSTVQKVDDILILEEGRIQEFGPRAQLAADPTSRFAHLLRTGQLTAADAATTTPSTR